MRRRDWTTAARLFAQIAAIRPDRPAIQVQLAHALKEQGRIADAERAYRRAVAAMPGNPDPALHLGHMLLREGARLAGLAALRHAAALGNEEAVRVFRSASGSLGINDFMSRPRGPDMAAVPALGLAGGVTGVRGAAIEGWVADVEDVSRPLTVELTGPNGKLIDSVRTEPDPAATTVLDAFGWRLTAPVSMLDGAAWMLTVALEDRTPLTKGRVPFRFSGGGICFVEADEAAISGWTESGADVSVSFDGGPVIVAPPGRALDKLAAKAARGFKVPMPEALLDGVEHFAEVRLAPTGKPLPGSPLRFRLSAPPGRITLHTVVGATLAGSVETAVGRPARVRVAAAFDDAAPVPLTIGSSDAASKDDRRSGEFTLETPPGARRVVFHRLDGLSPGPIAAFDLARPAAGPAQAGPGDGPPEILPVADGGGGVFASVLSRVGMTSADAEALAADAIAARQAAMAATLGPDAPLVSIVMPTHNRAYTLGEAIRSVLDQHYRRWELLIGDDASTDRTEQVVMAFRDPRIRYFAFEKSNGARTRNKALRFARGDVVAYLDSDNIWSPWYLSVMVRRLLRGAMAVHSGYADVVIDGVDARLDQIRRPSFHPIRLHERNSIDLNSYMHHRALHDWIGGFDPTLPRLQDWDLILRHSEIFPPSPEPLALVLYRRNAAWGQVTHLFAQHNIRAVVMEKSRLRAETGHTRLRIVAPARASLGLLCSHRAGARRLAASAARLFGPVADVEIYAFEARRAAAPAEAPHTRPPGGASARPVELSARLLDDPRSAGRLLAVTGRHDALIAMDIEPETAALAAEGSGLPIHVLATGRKGQFLASPGRGTEPWPLGALPLGPDPAPPPTLPGSGAGPLLLAFSGCSADGVLREAFVGAASGTPVLLAPPEPADQDWLLLAGGAPIPCAPAVGFALARGQADLTLAPGEIDALGAAAFSLLVEMMAQGAPPLLQAADFWEPLFEMSAASRLESADPKSMIKQAARLRLDHRRMDKMRRRAALAHRLLFHPELAEERLRGFACHLTGGQE